MKFEDIAKLKQEDLKKVLKSFLTELKYKPKCKDGFIYAKGNIPVLLVAHMDTVHKEEPTIICKDTVYDILMSPQGIGGDDRCGIYIILELLKTHKCHVLFTEDEETGCVGASKFCKSDIKPNVNFIIEFDRKGINDCVFYDCDNPEFTTFIESFGFKTDTGSCSDISSVAPYLGVAAVNLSCGYFNPHTLHEFVSIPIMDDVIDKSKKILDNCGTKFDYIEAARQYGNLMFNDYYNYDYGYNYGYDTIDEMLLYDEGTADLYTYKENLMVLNDDEFLLSLETGDMRDDLFAAIDEDCIVYLYREEYDVWTATGNYIAKNRNGQDLTWSEDRATEQVIFDYETYGVDTGYYEIEEEIQNENNDADDNG